jgi:RNA polymerase sigma factor (sigma-70 family)
MTCVVQSDEGYNLDDVQTASIPASTRVRSPLRSKRLLALASDERLVEQIRVGNEAAFEVAFERHGAAILGFCRHMLGSTEEAEDAVQQTFASAYRSLLRDDREIRLKPWLFTIARNRSISMLRGQRDEPVEEHDIPTAGLADEVERRAELSELLGDVRELPEEQRAALLLAELGDLSHAEVAGVIGVKVPQVKALVFRARSTLIARRDARVTPCPEIREQLANLSGGSLRRSGLRYHLRDCSECREYREQVKRQRRLLAVVLPVTPSLGLKSSVLSALGLGGGSAGGGGAVLGGLGAAATAPLGATVAKIAAVAVLAGGGAMAGQAALKSPDMPPGDATPAAQAAPDAAEAATPVGARPAAAASDRAKGRRRAAARKHRRAVAKARAKHSRQSRARAVAGRGNKGRRRVRGGPEGVGALKRASSRRPTPVKQRSRQPQRGPAPTPAPRGSEPTPTEIRVKPQFKRGSATDKLSPEAPQAP